MDSGKPIFWTSDWHIGHEKAIEYDKRPFKNINHMHESLITRYNSTVPENGVCFFVGDMGNKPEEMKKVIQRLRGTKCLFLGNHDKGMTTMYNCGFDVVLWGGVIYIGDIKVTISHCPLLDVWREDTSKMKNPGENWHGESREKHRQSATKDEGQFHLHGHIHSSPIKTQSTKILNKQYDVGVCANNYTPVSHNAIISWVMKTANKEQKP
jgi:calcineurin-like phosphoesterase family protein